MNKKENFYIFLDIDGVLWDWDWRLDALDKGKIKSKQFITEFNPKSIDALNYLLDKINETHEAKLVISSTWRSDLDFTKEIFDKHNVAYQGEYFGTKITNHPEKRGLEILDFLQNHEKGDFVIIDDEYCDLKQHFSNDKIIKTALYNDSLSKKHIDKWLEKHPELTSEQSEKNF